MTIDIHKAIGKLPIIHKKEFVLPNMNYCGPFNPLMIILQEKVAPVPLFTDNFQRIFTIRRYHPRCENLT